VITPVFLLHLDRGFHTIQLPGRILLLLIEWAVYWIRAEIHEFIFKNWKIVKVATTKSQRKLFFKLKKAKSHIYTSLSVEQAKEIANELGVFV
jgi:DNA-directed RNA polymerase sigma subunit (sigma70/sigma32)